MARIETEYLIENDNNISIEGGAMSIRAHDNQDSNESNIIELARF